MKHKKEKARNCPKKAIPRVTGHVMKLRQRKTRQSDLDSESGDEEYRDEETSLGTQRSPQPKRRATSTLKMRSTKTQCLTSGTATGITGGADGTATKSIYDMNIVEINDALKRVLQGQDETMDRLSDILYRFNQRPLPSGATDKKLILPLMLSGVSGTGKTATAKLLCELYQVSGAQYIRQDLTKITDDTQINCVLGAGPGLVGSTARTTLPMELLRAIGRAPQGKMDVDLTEEQYQRRVAHGAISVEGHTAPRTILLHFDETDKAYHKFMTLMLNFIEDGELTASNDLKFVLPRETRLIVVFTANFGWQTIKQLCPLSQYAEARQAIEVAMENYGVHRAVLGRLPYMLPYFELDADIMRHISDTMVCHALDNRDHPYRAQFSHIVATTGGDSHDPRVIEVIKKNYGIASGDLGMRGLETGLETFKTEFYYGIATQLLRHPPPPLVPVALPDDMHRDACSDVSDSSDCSHDDDDDDIITLVTVPLRPVTRSVTANARAIQKTMRESERKPKQAKRAVHREPKRPVPQEQVAPTIQLSYHVYAYPCEELVALRTTSPHSFTRAANNQIDLWLQQRHDVGLLMAHCHAHLIWCMVDRTLIPVAPLASLSSPCLMPPQKRRLILVGRRMKRCSACGQSHGKNEPCDDILGSDSDNSDDRMEISFASIRHMLSQHHKRLSPLMITGSTATACL